MPQVPTLTNQVSPQAAPSFQRAPLRNTVAQDLGQGISNAGSTLFEVRRQEQQKADRAAVLDARTQLMDAENTALYDPQAGAFAKQGKAAFDLPNQVLPKLDQTASLIAQGLKTDRQRTIFLQDTQERRPQIERDLNQHEYGQREKYYDQTDNASVLASIQSASLHPEQPERIAGELKTQRSIIDGMAQRKGWDDAQKTQAVQSFESKTHEAVIGNLMVKNQYEAARAYLAMNAAKMEDPAVEQLQRRIAVETDRLFTEQQRQQKLLSDAAAKDGDKLLAENRLSSAWIEQHRNTLDASDYRYFYNKLTSPEEGSAPRDVSLYADLRDRAGRGEDVRAESRAALTRGAIRVADYDRLTGEVESERPGWYKRGSEYIINMSGASLLNPDPAAPQLKATMLDQWSDWARTHSQASDRDAQSAYQDIVSHNMLVQRAGLPLPRLLVGGRFSPDLVATAKATVKAHDKGEMNDEDYAREMQVLQRWKKTLDSEKAQAPPK